MKLSNMFLWQVCEDIALGHLPRILLTETFKDLTQRKPDLTLPFVSQVLSKILPEGYGGHSAETLFRGRKSDT